MITATTCSPNSACCSICLPTWAAWGHRIDAGDRLHPLTTILRLSDSVASTSLRLEILYGCCKPDLCFSAIRYRWTLYRPATPACDATALDYYFCQCTEVVYEIRIDLRFSLACFHHSRFSRSGRHHRFALSTVLAVAFLGLDLDLFQQLIRYIIHDV